MELIIQKPQGESVKVAKTKALYRTEAALYVRLIECLTAVGGWEICRETAGFDIPAVWEEGGHEFGF